MATIYVVQTRVRPKGMRTTQESWHFEAAYSDLEDAEELRKALTSAIVRARVQEVPARGALAEILEPKPQLRATG